MKPKANRKTDHRKAGNLDCCQTPPHALIPLLPYLDPAWTIWECAAGEGLLVGGLQASGLRVTASDILAGQDFFHYEPDAWDAIVTNPPYSIKYGWLERCYRLGKPFALLMQTETLSAAKAQAYFERYGVELLVPNKRINFKMPVAGWNGHGAQFPVAWFTWGLNIGTPLKFVRLDTQLTLEGLTA